MPISKLLSATIASLLAAASAKAATLTVSSSADSNADDGVCTLREAIENANNDSQNGRTSPGECAAGSGADSIEFDPTVFAGTQTITLGGTHIAISSPLTITGSGRDRLIVDANATSRHFLIDDGNDATAVQASLSDLSLRNGRISAAHGGSILTKEHLTLARATLSGNTAVNTGTTGARGGALSAQPASAGAGLNISLDEVTLSGNHAGQGGALTLELSQTATASSVTLQNCTIQDNEARRDGGVVSPRSAGGRISVGAGSLLIEDSAISNNRSERDIGGLDIGAGLGSTVTLRRLQLLNNTAGTSSGTFSHSIGGLNLQVGGPAYGPSTPFEVEISDITIAGNSATQNNGGAYIKAEGSGQFVIQRSTVSGNVAQGVSGGGFAGGLNLRVYDATLTLRNSTVSGNTANGNGGGVYAYAYSDSATGRLVIENSTITGNTANANADTTGQGGGLALNSSSNSSGQFVVSNSVIAGNRDLHPSTPAQDVFPRSFTISFSNSLIGDNTGSGLTEAPLGSADGNGNLIGSASGTGVIAAQLSVLADYGGATHSHRPLLGSPLIDHFTGCSGTDQRSKPRGGDGNGASSANECDIGAVEFQYSAHTVANEVASVGEDAGATALPNLLNNETDTSTADDYTPTFTLTAVNGSATAFGNEIEVNNGFWNVASNGAATFRPGPALQSLKAGETAVSSLSYTISDGLGTADGTVAVTVQGANDAPVASNSSASGSEDGVLTAALAASDIDNDALTFAQVSAPSAGTLSFDHANKQFSFDPGNSFQSLKAGESQNLSFSYKANDGSVDSNVATVQLTINGANDAPLAQNDSYALEGGTTLVRDAANGLLANDSDVDGDTLSAVPGTFAATGIGGTLVLNADGSFQYSAPLANGSAAVDYTMTDGTISRTATVSFNVSLPALDLSISKNDGRSLVSANDVLTYTITVTNAGPSHALGARVQDILPAALGNASWTCEAVAPSANTACAQASGSGNIDELANIGAGDSLVFELMATLQSSFGSGEILNTVTVTAPSDRSDSNLANNSATDRNLTTRVHSDGFEQIVVNKRFETRSLRLTREELEARLAPAVGYRPTLVARAAATSGEAALMLLHARRHEDSLQIRISRFEHGVWIQGDWNNLAQDAVEVAW